MPIRWSRIHAKLGKPSGDLTFADLQAAIANSMTEEDDLDWKRAIPSKDGADEIAKDIAALANSRGGLLVYGVAQHDGTGAAKSFHSVDTGEQTQQQMRAIAASRIHPLVVGLEFQPISGLDDIGGNVNVLVLAVPRSPDAPHLIGAGERVGIPYRDGPDTRWMRERDLERAYADRFGRRASDLEQLSESLNDLTAHLDLAESAWLAGVARPRTPLPANLRQIARNEVRSILESCLKRTIQVAPTDNRLRFTIVRELSSAVDNPAIGLRRWVVRLQTKYGPDSRSNWVHVELHHDGSVALAVELNRWPFRAIDGKHNVYCPLVESFAADFVALAESAALHAGDTATIAARVGFVSSSARPFAAIDHRYYGHGSFSQDLEIVDGSRELDSPRSIDIELSVASDVEELRRCAKDIATDVLHQFGVQRLSVLPPS